MLIKVYFLFHVFCVCVFIVFSELGNLWLKLLVRNKEVLNKKRGIFSLTRTGINFLAQENQRRLNGMVYQERDLFLSCLVRGNKVELGDVFRYFCYALSILNRAISHYANCYSNVTCPSHDLSAQGNNDRQKILGPNFPYKCQ